MPNGWVHAVIDLVAYGRPYLDVHKEKDKAYRILGCNHRKVNHEWYQSFGKEWTLDNPFPDWLKEQISKIKDTKGSDKAEERMAYIDHDYIDKIWSGPSELEQRYREGFFMWVALNPKILKKWAGVDVLEGRIQRVINEREIWESCPELKYEYKRLRSYIEKVKRNSKILQDMLKRYGKYQQ
ncbi:hypothetical protein FJZ31_41705 [Candidatus Poribacteria bacterium]|nr:hypothetical protein [Candidatus Poribacteria bacterium]